MYDLRPTNKAGRATDDRQTQPTSDDRTVRWSSVAGWAARGSESSPLDGGATRGPAGFPPAFPLMVGRGRPRPPPHTRTHVSSLPLYLPRLAPTLTDTTSTPETRGQSTGAPHCASHPPTPAAATPERPQRRLHGRGSLRLPRRVARQRVALRHPRRPVIGSSNTRNR